MSAAVLNLALVCPKCGAGRDERCRNLRDGSVLSRSHVNRRVPAPCGTHGGYVRHVKAKEAPCERCREGHRRYITEYRRKNPAKRQADIVQLKARREAIKRLIARHRSEFVALLDECQAEAAS